MHRQEQDTHSIATAARRAASDELSRPVGRFLKKKPPIWIAHSYYGDVVKDRSLNFVTICSATCLIPSSLCATSNIIVGL